MPPSLRRGVALVTAAAMLAGCVSTREARIGADDGRDACRPQLVALDSTGNFFAEDIIRGAALGALGGAALGALAAAAGGGRGGNIATGAAIGAVAGGAVGAAGGYLAARQRQAADQAGLTASIAGDLAKENAELDRTQVAFDQLMYCRFFNAQRIRADLAAGRLTRPQAEALMADLRGRAQRDLQLAQGINARIGRRAAEFDTAVDAVSPGAKEQVAAAAVARRGGAPAQARAAVPLKLRPDPTAPEVARVDARERVTVRPAGGGFALVETSGGVRGYAPADAFPGTRGLSVGGGAAAGGGGGDVRSLAATNVARREDFTESVSNAERLVQGQGFELAG